MEIAITGSQTKRDQQRNKSQVKEKNKIQEQQLCLVETGNLPEKECRVQTVKMIQGLGKRMEAKTEKKEKMFKKHLK